MKNYFFYIIIEKNLMYFLSFRKTV